MDYSDVEGKSGGQPKSSLGKFEYPQHLFAHGHVIVWQPDSGRHSRLGPQSFGSKLKVTIILKHFSNKMACFLGNPTSDFPKSRPSYSKNVSKLLSLSISNRTTGDPVWSVYHYPVARLSHGHVQKDAEDIRTCLKSFLAGHQTFLQRPSSPNTGWSKTHENHENKTHEKQKPMKILMIFMGFIKNHEKPMKTHENP